MSCDRADPEEEKVPDHGGSYKVRAPSQLYQNDLLTKLSRRYFNQIFQLDQRNRFLITGKMIKHMKTPFISQNCDSRQAPCFFLAAGMGGTTSRVKPVRLFFKNQVDIFMLFASCDRNSGILSLSDENLERLGRDLRTALKMSPWRRN